MNGLKLHIDNREPPELKKWLAGNVGIECIFENLPAGDFEFRSTDNTTKETRSLLLIERKEIEDLCSSLKDGRFDEQKQKLSATVASQPRPIALLIEGDYSDHDKSKTIDSIILTTQFRDGFFVLRSTKSVSPADNSTTTAGLLLRITDLIQRGKFEPVSEEDQHRRFIASRSMHRAGGGLSRKQDWWQLALAQIDGVGPKAGEAIVAKYPTAQALLNAYQESGDKAIGLLADIKNASGRRLGPKISEKVHSTICGDSDKVEPAKKVVKKRVAKKAVPSTEECLFEAADD